MLLHKSRDAQNGVIEIDNSLLDHHAEFSSHCGLRRFGRDHPPGSQHLPHARKILPVVHMLLAFDMNNIKKAFGRDGETECVRESVQSSSREVGWVNDGLK